MRLGLALWGQLPGQHQPSSSRRGRGTGLQERSRFQNTYRLLEAAVSKATVGVSGTRQPPPRARGGSISKPHQACENMPPNYTQSVRYTTGAGNTSHYYYTASCGAEFTSPKAAWAHAS
jgi:hypothetical protein